MTALSSVPRGNPAASLRRDPTSPWRHLDLSLLSAVLAVALLGVLMVYSATRSTAPDAGIASTSFLVKQATWVAVGAVLMVAVTTVDYRRYHLGGTVAYLGGMVLLLGVLSPLGTEVNGSQSWFAIGSLQLQPAEFMKVATILVLANIGSEGREELEARQVLAMLGAAALPAVLILLQPDVGSVMVYGAVVIVVLVVAGAPVRHLAAMALIAVVGVIGVFQLDLIEDYQKDRLTQFANPESDASSAGYNAEQARTAIGNGGLDGTGLFKGTQTKLSYVPEQQTDFIFTVVGEELGFIGSATLLLLYGVIGWRIWRAAVLARDVYGTLICAGVLAMIIFQVFENIGMASGIMPITGLPLPLLSYGGSSTLTTFLAIGLVLNVQTRRFA